MPAPQSAGLDGEQRQLLPAVEPADAICQLGDQSGEVALEGVQTVAAELLVAALSDHIAYLPVCAAVEQHRDAAGPQAHGGGQRLLVIGAARQAKPEHIDRRADRAELQASQPSGAREAPIGPDGQRGAQLALAVLAAVADAADRAALLDQAIDPRAHHHLNRAAALGYIQHPGDEARLIQHHDVGKLARQAAQIGEQQRRAERWAAQCEALDPGVRQPQQLVGQAEVIEQLKRRWVQRVAAERAVEVLVRLEHGDADALPRQQQRQHGPGRPGPDDAAVSPIGCLRGRSLGGHRRAPAR